MKEIKGIKLSTWAKDNDMPYKKAWDLLNSGAFPAKTQKTDKGRILVMTEAKASQMAGNKHITFGIPQMAEGKPKQEIRASRFNRAGLTTPSFKYSQIESGILPGGDSTGKSSGMTAIHDAIRLCKKAYFNFSMFGNTIDAMTEFSTNKLFFRGGNAKSRKFFEELCSSLNILDFQDKFFREYYRSSNNFIYRFESIPQNDDIKKLNKVFGIQAAENTKLPSKYIILNPEDISVQANISFAGKTIYYKQLNGYELNRLRSKDLTEEEQNFLNSLPPEIQKTIKSGAGTVNIPLDLSRIYAIFYRKQDYEPMAVPMGYAVLKDIEWKAEMKQIDMAVSRTMQNFVLLVKMGYESKNGEYVYDQAAADAMRQLFESETVGKTLVADFTTEVEFKIPQIGDFLDPKKYQIVNEDIKTGLNYVLTGTDQKFSNQYIQVQLFIQRLVRAREAFLNSFLIPEIKRLSKALGFRSYPTPYFEDIDLKDDAEFNRIITRLTELGILTPGESFVAFETGRIPTQEESEEAQVKYKELRDKGFYEPLTGGPQTQKDVIDMTNKNQKELLDKQQAHDDKQKSKDRKFNAENPQQPAPQIVLNAPTKMGQPKGKPTGKTGKQSGQRKTRVTKASKELYSLSKIRDNIILAMQVKDKVKSALKEKNKGKELNENQSEIANEISNVILGFHEIPFQFQGQELFWIISNVIFGF